MNILCKWGHFERTDKMNEAVLCLKHSDDLYDKCRGPINRLLMYWSNNMADIDSVCEICKSGKGYEEKDIINLYNL